MGAGDRRSRVSTAHRLSEGGPERALDQTSDERCCSVAFNARRSIRKFLNFSDRREDHERVGYPLSHPNRYLSGGGSRILRSSIEDASFGCRENPSHHAADCNRIHRPALNGGFLRFLVLHKTARNLRSGSSPRWRDRILIRSSSRVMMLRIFVFRNPLTGVVPPGNVLLNMNFWSSRELVRCMYVCIRTPARSSRSLSSENHCRPGIYSGSRPLEQERQLTMKAIKVPVQDAQTC
jgi:hypothetical protein